MAEDKEEATENPGLPWLHGSDDIHRVDFAVDVAHKPPNSVERGPWVFLNQLLAVTCDARRKSSNYARDGVDAQKRPGERAGVVGTKVISTGLKAIVARFLRSVTTVISDIHNFPVTFTKSPLTIELSPREA